MRIRPDKPDRDFTKISHWINDERTHALWCAGRFPYPLSADSFHGVLSDMERNSGDKPFTAVDENGRAVGFFCCWIDRENSNAMLKFVVVDSSARGRGYGREMINLAARYAFDVETVDTVTLNESNSWTATVNNLEMYKDSGEEHVYANRRQALR